MQHADLGRVTVLIKTLLRDAHLEEAVGGLTASMPEAQLLIVDDGLLTPHKEQLYEQLRWLGHQVVMLPFDAGFGAKSNAALGRLTRPYLLVGSDDFDFRPAPVRQGIERLVTVLDGVPEVVVASGRVNNHPYEGWLRDYGDRIVEERLKYDAPRAVSGVTYHLCNLTVNYSLMRASILGRDRICWDDDIKIGGGEHGAQFIKIMRAGYRVAWVPGVNICEQSYKPTDPRYAVMRGRAREPGRPALRRLGVSEYVLFGGDVERT